MSEVWFAHPTALWGLLVIPLLWWRARTAVGGELCWTGALAIWRRAAQAASVPASRERRGLSLSELAALLAVLLGILALSGPERGTARATSLEWKLVLDRSPSMFLPARDSPAAVSRIERAAELALACCERAKIAAGAREWITYAFDGVHAARGDRPPPQWLVAAWGMGEPTPWSQLDLPDHLWVSDCEPDFAPRSAGRVHSGASLSPGAIADLGPRLLVWDGREISEQARNRAQPGLFVAGEIPLELELLAKVWAQERQLPAASDPGPSCLRIVPGELTIDAPQLEGRLIGDGWSVAARARPSKPHADFATWAEFEDRSGQRTPAVQWRPGEVRIALSSIAPEDADLAAQALAWASLFDAARLPDPEIVPLAERAQQGSELVIEPGASAQPEPSGAWSLSPYLAGLASALALAALALRRTPRPPSVQPFEGGRPPVISPPRAGLR